MRDSLYLKEPKKENTKILNSVIAKKIVITIFLFNFALVKWDIKRIIKT